MDNFAALYLLKLLEQELMNADFANAQEICKEINKMMLKYKEKLMDMDNKKHVSFKLQMDCCDSIPTGDVIEIETKKCLHCDLIYVEREFVGHKCSAVKATKDDGSLI